jgi:hypothetical protein
MTDMIKLTCSSCDKLFTMTCEAYEEELDRVDDDMDQVDDKMLFCEECNHTFARVYLNQCREEYKTAVHVSGDSCNHCGLRHEIEHYAELLGETV